MTDFRKSINAWVEKNPLRIFRANQDNMTQTELSVAIAKNKDTIVAWERGNKQPNDESMAQLIAFTKDPDFEKKWTEWYDSRPEYHVNLD